MDKIQVKEHVQIVDRQLLGVLGFPTSLPGPFEIRLWNHLAGGVWFEYELESARCLTTNEDLDVTKGLAFRFVPYGYGYAEGDKDG